ncbi:MAG: signal peptidase II [Oscillospiraceae bacterium]|nr:signal peptidase II [Oscillospiraceae bacterium]
MIIFAVTAIILLVACDQLIKYWCVNNLVLHESVDFIKIGDFKIFDLTLHYNTGAIFGSMAGKRFFLIFSVLIITAVCIYALIRYGKSSKLFYSSMILMISGGIGNLIDRLFNGGKVIDMFDFQLFNFAIFNFADICVTVGAVLFCIYSIFIDGRKNGEKKNV